MASEPNVKTGRCLWCEQRDTEIFADGLCRMCTETSPPDEVTPDMVAAWVAYEPPAGFEVEQDIGYNDAVAMIRQAFMNGYARGREFEGVNQ